MAGVGCGEQRERERDRSFSKYLRNSYCVPDVLSQALEIQ